MEFGEGAAVSSGSADLGVPRGAWGATLGWMGLAPGEAPLPGPLSPIVP